MRSNKKWNCYKLINRDNKSVEELVLSIGDYFKAVDKDNLCALVDFVDTEKEHLMGYVKCGQKTITINSMQTVSIPCRVNAGYIEQPTPVSFEADADGSFSSEVQFHDTLVTMKRGNVTRINVLCTNTGSYDYLLRGRIVLGCLKQIRLATPLEVKLVEPKEDRATSKKKREDTLKFELNEEGVPSVDIIITGAKKSSERYALQNYGCILQQ